MSIKQLYAIKYVNCTINYKLIVCICLLLNHEQFYNYYSIGRSKPQNGGLLICKSGWCPYKHQYAGSFLSGLTSALKTTGKVLAPMAKALKPVAAKVGKKLTKISMNTLKDWAEHKNMNDAIQDNLWCAGIETANEVQEHIDAQEVSGHKRKMPIKNKKPRCKHDCFDIL